MVNKDCLSPQYLPPDWRIPIGDTLMRGWVPLMSMTAVELSPLMGHRARWPNRQKIHQERRGILFLAAVGCCHVRMREMEA